MRIFKNNSILPNIMHNEPTVSYDGRLPNQPIHSNLQYLMAQGGVGNGQMSTQAFIMALESVPLEWVRRIESRMELEQEIGFVKAFAKSEGTVTVENFEPDYQRLEAFVNTTFAEMHAQLTAASEARIGNPDHYRSPWIEVDRAYYGNHDVKEVLLAIAKHSYETAVPRGNGKLQGFQAPSMEIDFEAFLEYDANGNLSGLVMDYIQGRDCRTLVRVEGDRLQLHAYAFEQREVTAEEFHAGVRKSNADMFLAEVKKELE